MSALFVGLDPAKVDDYAGRLVDVIAAVLAFADHAAEAEEAEEDLRLREAAVTKALLTVLAALIAHPHTDEEQQDHLAAEMGSFLIERVAEARAAR